MCGITCSSGTSNLPRVQNKLEAGDNDNKSLRTTRPGPKLWSDLYSCTDTAQKENGELRAHLLP